LGVTQNSPNHQKSSRKTWCFGHPGGFPTEMLMKIVQIQWFPMQINGNANENRAIPMVSYGNGTGTIGFLWIPMEMVRNPLDPYGFLWEWQGNHWIPVDSYGNGK